MLIKQINSLKDIISLYDVFFVDLWGVIHDGISAYDGAKESLIKLKEAGKKVIFISNAPRRISKAIEGLTRLNISEDLYNGVITSGEMVFNNLTENNITSNNNKYIIVGPERDAGLLDHTEYLKVSTVQDANFMILTGYDNDDSPQDEKQPYLDEAIKLNMPVICANPDLIVVRKTGKEALCAGFIAKKYEEMGGKVTYFGKPHMPIYHKAQEIAGNIDKKRIAAIGDSLITDIKGANDFGMDSYLIPGGILGRDLHITHGQIPEQDKLEKLCREHNIYPYAIMPEFIF